MEYPGRVIKVGEKDADLVHAIKRRLNELLSDPAMHLTPDDGSFGPRTRQTVKLFQARNVDAAGRPLLQNGEIGASTWSAMFGPITVDEAPRPIGNLLDRVLRVAAGEAEKRVREVPRNSNRGPEVDDYLLRAGAQPGQAWCCAFVYWCFDEAASALGRSNPMVRTAGCLDHWRRAPNQGAQRISRANAIADPRQVLPGMVFIIDHGGGLGHTGLIEQVSGDLLTTIEGNTDGSGTREGGGVYRLKRKVSEINKGFIDYALL